MLVIQQDSCDLSFEPHHHSPRDNRPIAHTSFRNSRDLTKMPHPEPVVLECAHGPVPDWITQKLDVRLVPKAVEGDFVPPWKKFSSV